jgi:hypothetical protein
MRSSIWLVFFKKKKKKYIYNVFNIFLIFKILSKTKPDFSYDLLKNYNVTISFPIKIINR